MSQKSLPPKPAKPPAEAVVRNIRRATRRHYSAEDKIRIVLEGLRGEQSIAELCRREGIAESMYWRDRSELVGGVLLCAVLDQNIGIKNCS